MQSYRGIPTSVMQQLEKDLLESFNIGTILHRPKPRAAYGIYGDSVDRFKWIMTYGLRGF